MSRSWLPQLTCVDNPKTAQGHTKGVPSQGSTQDILPADTPHPEVSWLGPHVPAGQYIEFFFSFYVKSSTFDQEVPTVVLCLPNTSHSSLTHTIGNEVQF